MIHTVTEDSEGIPRWYRLHGCDNSEYTVEAGKDTFLEDRLDEEAGNKVNLNKDCT